MQCATETVQSGVERPGAVCGLVLSRRELTGLGVAGGYSLVAMGVIFGTRRSRLRDLVVNDSQFGPLVRGRRMVGMKFWPSAA